MAAASTAVYRQMIESQTPDNLEEPTQAAAAGSLWVALAVQADLSPRLIENAKAAFTAGFNGATALSAVSVAFLAILAAVALRHFSKLGKQSGH